MLVIGLTGGIGSGKSVVAQMLGALGAVVVDADKVGHQAYAPDTDGWREVVAEFGEFILHEDRTVDRAKLGQIVFNDPKALARLNEILHPKMAQMIDRVIKEQSRRGIQAVVVEAAILLEAKWQYLVDEIWVVVAAEDNVVKRLAGRSKMSPEEVRSRIRAQLSNEERLRQADVAIYNDGSLEELEQKVAELWNTRVAI